MTLPVVTATGGLVADPELRWSAAGKAWASFRIACKDRIRDQNGQWSDGPATFVSVTTFGKMAENLAESAAQGDLVTVVGKLRQRDWEDREGQKRTTLEIVADEVAVNLTFNTAKSPRITGDGGGTGAQGGSWGTPAQAVDPWGVPTSPEPPF